MKTFNINISAMADDNTTADEIIKEILTLDKSERDFNKVGLLKIDDVKVGEVETPEQFLEKPFGLKGQKIVMLKGEYSGKKGKILQETGYTDAHGVVCKIKLEDGTIGEWSHDFFELP